MRQGSCRRRRGVAGFGRLRCGGWLAREIEGEGGGLAVRGWTMRIWEDPEEESGGAGMDGWDKVPSFRVGLFI